MSLAVNLNDRVRVKLNEVGLNHYRQKREATNAHLRARGVRDFFPTEPKLDADGYYETQLWNLINEFGEAINLGMVTPFKNCEIIIDKVMEAKSGA